MVVENLKTFAKNTNLVQFPGCPAKSPELIAYEQQLRSGKRTDAASSADPPRADPPRADPPRADADPPPAENQSTIVPPTTVQPPTGRGAANPKLAAFGTSIL